ncbi:MerR family transcriptional regulator [Methylocystis hirsuta]|uniref:DNA-binding protein n=1 Tax=Methylocystis hirsuta TaxID=369798 RepID=A0A3M9XNR2_9HYPH|nr:MerR family transcriptional regulator [Methylocystis hirsuta]RNJ49392.1 DNA-binding protein [Methylocystis hirsuta]
MSNEKPPLPPVYTAADLAAHFKVDPDTISMWAKKGLLPKPLNLPGRRRWSGPAIEAFLRGESFA